MKPHQRFGIFLVDVLLLAGLFQISTLLGII